MLKEE
jgi:glutamyl-tRNA synthetase